MAYGSKRGVVVQLQYKARGRAALAAIAARSDETGGYVGECIISDAEGNVLGHYLTPIYRRGQYDLRQKALASAETIYLNLVSGYQMKGLPLEVRG